MTVTNQTIHKQVDDMKAGKMGTWLQGYAMTADVIPNLASGDSFEVALEKASKAGKGSWADRVGSKIGDEAYDFINKDYPEAKEFVKKDIGRLKNAASEGWHKLWAD